MDCSGNSQEPGEVVAEVLNGSAACSLLSAVVCEVCLREPVFVKTVSTVMSFYVTP